LNGILYVLTTGCRWMDMPLEYGSYKTAWRRLKRWQDEGVWYEASVNIQSPNNNSTNNHTPKIRNFRDEFVNKQQKTEDLTIKPQSIN